MIDSRNIFQPRLPLVCIPRMFLKHCFHLLDGLRVLLQKDFVSDGIREHMAGEVPGRCGCYGKCQKQEKCEQGHVHELCHTRCTTGKEKGSGLLYQSEYVRG